MFKLYKIINEIAEIGLFGYAVIVALLPVIPIILFVVLVVIASKAYDKAHPYTEEELAVIRQKELEARPVVVAQSTVRTIQTTMPVA